MCITRDYYTQLQKVHEEVAESFELLRKKSSEIDKQVSEIYHEIEMTRFDVVRGYRLAKRLQEVLIVRRVVKDEYAKLHVLRDSLNSHMRSIDERVTRAFKRSEKRRRVMNVKLSIEDVIEEI